MEGQVVPPPLRAMVVHAVTGENVGRVGVNALPGCQAGQSAQIGQRVLAPHDHVGRCTLLGASGRCCAKEPRFPEKLLRSRAYELAARRPARSLSARQEVPEVEAPVHLAGSMVSCNE